MPTPKKKEPQRSLLLKLFDAQISQSETRTAQLRASKALFLGEGPILATDSPRKGVRGKIKSKPTSDAVSRGLVTTGGQLVGFDKKIIKQLASGAQTTKQVADALYVTGLGLSRAKFRKRIGQGIYMLKADGQVKPSKSGVRPATWALAK